MGLKRGLFITFEGPEGSGKSTQIARTVAYLKKRKGRRPLLLREPGGTAVGEAIRKILLNRHFREMTPGTELLLYLAARAQLVAEKILPALRKGEVVVCDRFEDSTLAYQGFGRKIPLQAIEEVSRRFVRGRVKPDLTFLLDINPRVGIRRGGRHDRMEQQSFAFHDRVRRGFLKLAQRNRKRLIVVDATLTPDKVFKKIRDQLDRVID